MSQIILSPKSKHGKDVIHSEGANFLLLETVEHCLCHDNDKAMLLQSLKTGDKRWVRFENDKNFIWKEDR
jgi:hypothetical protein